MSLIKEIKRHVVRSVVGLVSCSMVLSSAVPAVAVADDSTTASAADEVVGNLSLVSMYEDGQGVTDGHSFVVFTSYEDDLELNFTNLYGYYEMTDSFKAATEADESQLSWRAQFDEMAKKVGSDVTLEEYLKTGEDDREHKYPELYKAIYEYGDKCFTYTEGTQVKDERYKKTSYDCKLGTGEYITIGDYVFSSQAEMIKYALLNSTLKDKLLEILKTSLTRGHTEDEVLSKLEEYIGLYIDGKIDDATFEKDVKEYAAGVLTETGLKTYETLVSSYQNRVNLLDGDAKGGMFVNRELWRQKVYQTLSTNKIYSIDITRSQLERMMSFVNSEKNDQNHYAVLAHNCSTLSSGIWNAVVGTDASGNKTNLYMNAFDNTYAVLDGLFTTPKKIYSVIGSWNGNADLGGKATFDQEYIHGVTVPSYTVSFDAAGGSSVASQSVLINRAAAKPADPTREGYTFKGWLLNGAAYDFATGVTANVVLTASWEKNATPQPEDNTNGGGSASDAGKDANKSGKKTVTTVKKTLGALPKTGDTAMLAAVSAAAIGTLAFALSRKRLQQ